MPTGGNGDALIVPVDPVAIIVMRAGKADHLPRRHVLVAAIDRVGEKAVLGVLEDELEEILASVPSSLSEPSSRPLMTSSFCSSERSAKTLPPNLSRQAASSAASALRYCCAGVTGDCGPCCLVPCWNGPLM